MDNLERKNLTRIMTNSLLFLTDKKNEFEKGWHDSNMRTIYSIFVCSLHFA